MKVKQLIVLAGVLASSLTSAKPGNEVQLNDKTFEAELYVLRVADSETGEIGAIQLVLLPPAMVHDCEGKTFEECRTTKVTDARSNEVPTRPLDLLVTNEPQLIKFLRAMQRSEIVMHLHKAARDKSPLIRGKNKIRHKVHWMLWSNGESFELK